MNSLITVQAVLERAFSARDYLPPNLLNEERIRLAEERYLRPVVGESLYAALQAGSYPALLEEFVAPILAFGVKLMLLPELQLNLSAGGLLEPYGEGWHPLSSERLLLVRQSLRQELNTLRSRLDEELERLSKAGELPEYDPTMNIRKRCRIYGDFVAIR